MIRSAIAQLAAALALASSAGSAGAGEAQDRLFAVGLLGEVAAGERLIYGHDRGGRLAGPAVPPIEDGTVELAVVPGADGRREARIELTSEGKPVTRTVLPADGGHPIFLLFLETSARTVAELTGGSPFYIRNRMRAALAAEAALAPVEVTVGGAPVAAREVTFRPFAEDPNRAALGPFADLALTMVLSEAVPGGFARLEAVTGNAGEPAFSDRFVFERLEEE